MPLPIYQFNNPDDRREIERLLDRLRETASATEEAAQTVAAIIDDVQRDGDDAVVRYMRRWTDPDFDAASIRVSPDELNAAERSLDADTRRAMTAAIEHVRQYQTHLRPKTVTSIEIDGARLGLRFTPIKRVGLIVPGGKAAYPSSVIMLTIPALAAGVLPEDISLATPPPTRSPGQPAGRISALVLAACKLCGVERVYRIGGAQAVAAMALGAQTIKPVDLIAGPGNIYTQLAKMQLAGQVGVDGFYGPSEIVTLADESANPTWIAADLIAQAEHDPGKCFLIAWSKQVIERIVEQVGRQLPDRARRGSVESALQNESCAVLVGDVDQAIALADTIAAEHVNLAVAQPNEMLAHLKNGGEFFLGHQTPVAAGDYFAGPSHCLPTGTTARFSSGVSVYTFLKRSGVVEYPKGMNRETIDAIARLAEAEGLDAHAHSARLRGQ